jgi:hypothetical protein
VDAQVAGELVVMPIPGAQLTHALPRWRVVLWLIALTGLVALLAASYLAYTGSVATLSYSSQRMRSERDTWHARNEQLRLEVEKRRSLTWVEHEAVSRLQMQKPTELIYLKMDPPEQGAPASRTTGSR